RAVARRTRGDRDLHARCARRRPDRDRRLARRGHGRYRPVIDEIREVAKQYPESKSAILPALRIAQDRYGWLSREAFDQVADALDLTPAYCMSVASFYDMFQLEPTGEHMIEVCTNVCCGLVNAQAVLEAFERELGVSPG